ncbi:MAG: acetyl-CoA carboxylase biotin carboxyl carrier protein [Streptosporangiaceae bacterium]
MAVRNSNIRRVITAFERGDWDEIHLVTEDVELHLSTTLDGFSSQTWDVSTRREPPSAAPGQPERGEEDCAVVAEPAGADGTGLAPVTAPSPGIFWRSPLPGAPPFTDRGQRVADGDVLCIVEVMKLMNHVTAHVSGTIMDILVENGQPVTRGQVLFRIRSDEN